MGFVDLAGNGRKRRNEDDKGKNKAKNSTI